MNALSPLVDAGFIEEALRRYFQPLLDPSFDEILSVHYPRGVRFLLNGRPIDRRRWTGAGEAWIAVRLGRRRKPVASGYMIHLPAPLPEERQGITIATLGKTIKHGWDWLGVAPQVPAHVGGLIEAPALAECLTLNKADFIRTGGRGAMYLAYRKAIQEAVSHQLAAWGDTRNAGEHARRRAARPVERDLETVLMDLADRFPLLAALVEQRAGGQRRLPMGGSEGRAQQAESQMSVAGPPALSGIVGEAPMLPMSGDETANHSEESAPRETPEPEQTTPKAEGRLASATGGRGRGRYGLSIQFEQRPEDPELGRLVESTVWVNEAHPAYRRALASRSEGYHIALATAMALAPLAVDSSKEHEFVTAFLATWGAAIDRNKGSKRR